VHRFYTSTNTPRSFHVSEYIFFYSSLSLQDLVQIPGAQRSPHKSRATGAHCARVSSRPSREVPKHTMASYSIVSALLLLIPAVLVYYRVSRSETSNNTAGQANTATEKQEDKPKTIMQPPTDDLAPPKDDPFTQDQLREFDGSDPSKPIYVAIKGTWLQYFEVRHGCNACGRYHL
jgi:hypothetical protein